MKKLATIITSALLCVAMLALAPAQMIASAAESSGKYISEVKVGMGVTSDEASKELLAEGFTILKDDKGENADLNKDAGSKSILKGGPNQKIVYLGYKTTDDASDAVTDLAVMNMKGGYSFDDYNKLMETHMETQIKPFVNRFVATLNEYRANLKKPQDSANFKRANYYKTLLNKLTDDDTGNRPLGDLLVNQTKYEMGEDAYNKLSDTEKKNHCDIVTLLMQGSGPMVQLMETQLTKASDSSDDTWLDRFQKTNLNALTEEIKKENPALTPTEINKELDKKYNDDAKKLRDKWTAFNDILINYENAIDSAEDVIDASAESPEAIEIDKNSSKETIQEAAKDAVATESTMVQGGMAAEDIVAHDYLSAIEYGKGTMLEFFEKDVTEFNNEKKIRELYPMVEALSGGQLAGIDFLSIKDMIMMAVTDADGYKEVPTEEVVSVSVYQGVNREIYEKGGVALTNAALRVKAAAQEASKPFELSPTGIVLWSCTAAAGIAAAASGIVWKVFSNPNMVKLDSSQLERLKELKAAAKDAFNKSAGYIGDPNPNGGGRIIKVEKALTLEKNYKDAVKAVKDYQNDAMKSATKQAALKSTICKYLTAGFTVVMAILAGVSIYTTIAEMMEYYKVDFTPIPKYMVEETDITATNEKGEKIMIENRTAYYKAVTCNRTDGGGSDIEKKNHEILKDRADLNGDVGRQWLALYSVKYENGLPILADSLKLKLGKGPAPEGYTTGIHMFGEAAVQNLTDSKALCYNDPNEGTYVFYKQDTTPVNGQTAAGSLFSGGSIALGLIVGLLAGGGLMWLLTIPSRKKREKDAA